MSFVDAVRKTKKRLLLRRWGACGVDYLLLAAIAVFILEKVPESSWVNLATIPALLFFPLLEGLTGFTLGKWLFRIRVVDGLGRPPGLMRASIRTLLRFVEVNPILFGGLPAGLIAHFSPDQRRLGDMCAGTLVLYAPDVAAIHFRLDFPLRIPESQAGDEAYQIEGESK